MKGKVNVQTGLAEVDLSVSELRQLAKDLGRGVALLARNTTKAALPQYGDCAKGLYEIAMILRHSVWNVTRTYNDFLYFSLEGSHALDELQALCRPFVERIASQIAADMKFNCGEIDSIYRTHCDRTLQSIYAKVVRSSRRKQMQRALQKMKHHDAEMIRLLVTAVIEPIAAFSRQILKTKDVREAKRLHAKLVRKIEGKAEKVEQILNDLDEAVRTFANLARTTLRSAK